MKKVLLTSTALFALSGAAAFAEVTLSGSAEMGVAGASAEIDRADGTSGEVSVPWEFFQDVDVDFTLTGETDGGLAFGANVDLDEAGNLGDEFSNQGVDIFISGAFGTVTMGDTDGAVDFVITDAGNIANPGSINDAETVHLGYNGAWLDGSGDGQIVRYDYSFEGFTFAASVEQMPSDRESCDAVFVTNQDGDIQTFINADGEEERVRRGSLCSTSSDGSLRDGDDDITWAVGFGYSFEFGGGSLDTGVGYQYSDNGSLSVGDSAEGVSITLPVFQGEVAATAVGATVNLDNGVSAGAGYTLFDADNADKGVHHWFVGGGYSFDAISVHANYGEWNAPTSYVSGYGLSAGYDLGGGASLLAGYGASTAENNAGGELTTEGYSFGLSFSF